MRQFGFVLSLLMIGLVSACTTTQLRHPDFGQDCRDLRPDDNGATNVDCVTVFYGTNRLVELAAPISPDQEADTPSVLPVDASTLTLGRADIWLPALVEKGGTRAPGETPQLKGDIPEDQAELSKYVFLTRITANGTERFVEDLENTVWDTGDGSILLFIHGFNVEFEPALIRSAQLAVDLSRDGIFNVGTPVLFSWPSNGKMSLSYYQNDRDRSANAAPYLREFMDILTRDVEIERINIIAHSMGNRVLTKALEDYAKDIAEREEGREIEFRIILAAADVDSKLFDQTTGILDTLDANVTIYTSDKDRALQVSSIINRAPRLGDTNGNRPYIRPDERYQTVDATGVATELFGLGHGYYSDNPFVLGDMLCSLIETDPDDRALQRRRYADDPDAAEYFQVDAAIEPFFEECSLVRSTIPNTDAGRYFVRGETQAGGTIVPPPPPPPAPSPPPPPPLVQGEAMLVERLVILNYDTETFDIALFEDQLLSAMRSGKLKNASITVRTDTVGTIAENQERSEIYAKAFKDFFIAKGLVANRITTYALGETQPFVPTPDETPAPENRRIEILLALDVS
jgi:esterase/lipase superfamily enzyme